MGSNPYVLNLLIEVETGEAVPAERLEEAIAWVLAQEHCAPGTGLSIVIGDDEAIRQMNRHYRGIDAPTDVLSFQADPPPVPEGSAPYLGDLVLGLPTIQRQARAEGHSWIDEMVLAVVHGTLHLLGYDHDTVEHQRRMWAVQRRALEALGVAIVVPEYDLGGDEAGAGQEESE